jgi:signal transduction histidine kinase
VLSGATFLLCAGVILMFFPLLNITLEGLLDSSIKQVREAKEVEATTIARLMVLEFSQLRDLLEVKPGAEKEVDQRIKNLIWQKVTFNEIVEGIELIQGQSDAKGQHVTYLFYRREAPELKPMAGPQKISKKFSGSEKELLDFINARQKVDKTSQEAINWGPKEEGQMLLRYMPVHVLVPEEGAIYWGVAKIGIDTSALTQLLALQNKEQDRIRKDIWLGIILSLTVSGVLAVSLLYVWARSLTEPLRALSQVAQEFKTAQPEELELWLENLRRVDSRGQTEVDDLKETLVRLGSAIPRLGERLFASEHQACLTRLVGRALPHLLLDSARLRRLQGQFGERCQNLLSLLEGTESTAGRQGEAGLAPSPPPQADFLRELDGALGVIERDLSDWQCFTKPEEGKWQKVDLEPILTSAWRLATMGLPPGMRLGSEITPLPPVWGTPGLLAQAVLLLLEYATGILTPEGQLTLAARPSPSGGVSLLVTVSGPAFSSEDCHRLLNPYEAGSNLEGSLGPALAAAIALQHGGQLTAQPGESPGLVLTLELPPPPVVHGTHEPYI